MAAQNRHQQIQLQEKLIHSSTQPMLSDFAEKWNLKLCHASKVMSLMRKPLLKKKQMSDCLSFNSKSTAEIKFAVCTEYIRTNCTLLLCRIFFFVI